MPKKFKPVVNETTLYVQGRLSYAHLLEPYAPKDSDDKAYSTVVLIDKDDTASINAINKAVEAAIAKGIGTKWNNKKPRVIAHPLHDGDDKEAEDFHGKMYFNCKAKRAPAVLDRKKQPIMNAEEVYSGMWGIVCVNMFPYYNTGKAGVSAGLNAVLKTADDEAFSGGSGARAFDSIDIGEEDDDLDDDMI